MYNGLKTQIILSYLYILYRSSKIKVYICCFWVVIFYWYKSHLGTNIMLKLDYFIATPNYLQVNFVEFDTQRIKCVSERKVPKIFELDNIITPMELDSFLILMEFFSALQLIVWFI